MKKAIVLIFTLLTSLQINAQTVKKTSIDISVGYGISAPYDDVDVTGTGFFLQGEYVLRFNSWFEARPYAGFILAKTSDKEKNETGMISDANAFLIGGKVRLTAPIPWVAPYLESGIGASIGSFETLTPFTNIEKSGLVYHIPLSLGLELGPKRNFDIAFTYYFHPTAEQFSGAAAFGISIPLSK